MVLTFVYMNICQSFILLIYMLVYVYPGLNHCLFCYSLRIKIGQFISG